MIMNKQTVQSILYGLMVLLISGCHEELEPTPYQYSRYFTGENSKTWALTYVEETEQGKVIDRFPVDCTKDDEYIFYATSDRLYEVKSGSTKCFTDEPASMVDSWAFTNASATLTIILPVLSSQPLPFIVRKVDDNDLTLEIFLDQEGTASYRIYFELKDEE
jgi:hypothetical protein